MNKKMTRREMFNNLFGQEDKYFGEWYIKADDSLTEFLENLEDGEKFFTHIQYLYLYFETLEILRKEGKKNYINKDFSIARIMCNDTRYCCILLLLIGLVDQNTKKEKRTNNETLPKRLKDRFQLVMNYLPDTTKNEMITLYRGNGKFDNFDDVTLHLYGTRNFFAHDIVPSGTIPQDGYLAFDNQRCDLMYLNLPHGKIFLNIIVAIILYLGFIDKIEVTSNKEFESLQDMLRTS